MQKEDLIAELKMSKDITGIKKMKVERAKVEERQEKEMFTEITKQFTTTSFVEKVIFKMYYLFIMKYISCENLQSHNTKKKKKINFYILKRLYIIKMNT